jgi:ABC-type transport system involved in multi-copper enzyme maturation permease subunit
MNSVWRSLLWKEWREHRWKLAALVVMFVGVPVLCSLRHADNFFSVVSISFFLLIPISAMFLAMSIAAGEEARGTIHFLRSLPLAMSRQGAAKLLLAMLTVVTPVVLTVVVAWIWSHFVDGRLLQQALNFDKQLYKAPWGIENWFLARAVSGSLAGISILIWVAAAGVNRADEVRGGVVGVFGALAVWAALLWLGMVVGRNGFPQWWHLLVAAAPGGPSGDPNTIMNPLGTGALERLAYFWPFAAVAAISHGALAAWFCMRFGRKTHIRTLSPAAGVKIDQKAWLAPPRRSPLTAILWKQVRESALLAVAMAAAIAMAAAVGGIYSAWNGDDNPLGQMVAVSVAFWGVGGFTIAVVAGTGVFMEDFKPGLHTFWRSRPVDVNQWFAVKFFTGLVSTFVVIGAVPLAAIAVAKAFGAQLPPHDAGDILSYVRSIFFIQVGVYCVSVLMMVLIRHAAYAAVLTLMAVALFAASLEPFSRWWPSSFANLAAVMIVLAGGAAAIVARLALRKDWGWKG